MGVVKGVVIIFLQHSPPSFSFRMTPVDETNSSYGLVLPIVCHIYSRSPQPCTPWGTRRNSKACFPLGEIFRAMRNFLKLRTRISFLWAKLVKYAYVTSKNFASRKRFRLVENRLKRYEKRALNKVYIVVVAESDHNWISSWKSQLDYKVQ